MARNLPYRGRNGLGRHTGRVTFFKLDAAGG